MYQQLFRYYHTIKYLKFRQIYYRLYYRFRKPKKPNLANFPELKQQIYPWKKSVFKQNQNPESNQFIFLNKMIAIDLPKLWSHPEADKLWLYNLHYFDYLNAEHTDSYADFYQNIIHGWISNNQLASKIGWEPYPVSLRIVNWIKYHLRTHSLSQQALESLAIQTELLSKRLEYHLMGNHLLANAVALIFSGLFFSGDIAEKWFKKGVKILHRELDEQILDDGGHFELSPMYHAIILENLLDLINLFSCYQKKIPDQWFYVVTKMLSWLQVMTHPDGKIAFFNDATFNVAPSYGELMQYALRLNINIHVNEKKSSTILKSSGFAKLENNGVVLIADVGNVGVDYIPGHAHADHLSYELSKNGRRIFVNSGVSCYEISAKRQWQRSSASHNTLVIDDKNSSDVWSGFRVGRRAYIKNLECEYKGSLKIVAQHNGYRNLNITHRRMWELEKNRLIITDNVDGQDNHTIAIYFYLSPGLMPKIKDNMILIYDMSSKKQIGKILSDTHCNISVSESEYYPGFGMKQSNYQIKLQQKTRLPAQIKTQLLWAEE